MNELQTLRELAKTNPDLRKELEDLRMVMVDLFNSSELPARDNTLMAAELQLIRLDEVLA